MEEVDTGIPCLYRWALEPPVCEEDQVNEVTHACIRKVGHDERHRCSCGETHANAKY